MEKEIELNIYKRFPSLDNSPGRNSNENRSASRGDSTLRSRMNKT